MLGQRPQDMGSVRPNGLPELEAGKLGIMQQQHIGLHKRQQLIGHRYLGLLAALNASSKAGMAATLAEQEQTDLRKGPGAVLIAGTLESRRIGGRIGHILPAAIDGHESSSKAVSSRRLWGTQRPTAGGKQPS